MTELLKFLSTNSLPALIFAAAVLILALTVTAMCIAAFVQGRSISFWPPSIGGSPNADGIRGSYAKLEGTSSEVANGSPGLSTPVVDRGTVLRAASGQTYQVMSGFYGGANATIYKATDKNGASVLAKMYWRGLAPNSPPWELFQQEQRAAEILSHRNIVRMLDRGLRTGYPFTIIEFMGGGTLRDWLRTHDRLPGRDVVSVASQLADAIDFAHSRGVIHRDIKPGNVLFESDPNGRVALSDFGIAAIMGAVQRDITAVEGGFSGTPGYLAPELLLGTPPQNLSDIYSFGVVLYEMVTGKIPFDEFGEPLALIRAKVDNDVPDIRRFRPDVPEHIAMEFQVVLARNPELRPSSARLALATIEKWLVTN
jgi:eukaryotic-like serine/threonine-protein kinase